MREPEFNNAIRKGEDDCAYTWSQNNRDKSKKDIVVSKGLSQVKPGEI